MKELWRSLVSVVEWLPVVAGWRWWDYEFSVDLLAKDLQLRIKRWGKETRYTGDYFTLGRMVVVLRYYEEYKNSDSIYDEDRLLKKFLKAYARLLPRLWD